MTHFHSKNLRKGRYSAIGQYYLITSVTRDRRRIFTNWQTGGCLAREFQYAEDIQLVENLAWVIMPDHFHWLLNLQDIALPKLLQRIKSKSAIALNSLLHEHGTTIWQKGYHDHALRKEEDVKDSARYIVANPLRAGLVTNLNDYPLWNATWVSS